MYFDLVFELCSKFVSVGTSFGASMPTSPLANLVLWQLQSAAQREDYLPALSVRFVKEVFGTRSPATCKVGPACIAPLYSERFQNVDEWL